MLSTIVRGLIVFVLLCLVSAARPMPRTLHDDPRDAQLDVAKSRVERVASRRIDPDRQSRAPLVVAVVTEPFVVAPPQRVRLGVARHAASCPVVPVRSARSSRGPPVA